MIGPMRSKVHLMPMPVAPPKATVPTATRFGALGKYISEDAKLSRMATSEEFPLALFVEADQAEQEKEWNIRLSSLTSSTLASFPERFQKNFGNS